MDDHLEARINNTSLICGRSSVSNSNINDNTIISKQINIYPPGSTSAKIGCAFIWFRVQEPVLSYTGRGDDLEEVHNAFFPTNEEVKSVHQIAIVGLGGVGKSELARKFAQIYHVDFDKNVIWINAENAQLLVDSFKELADELGIKSTELTLKSNILKMINTVYGYFGARKSLFIFDNVESWADGENAIREYLPKGIAPDAKKPFVLMTSRVRPSGIKVIELSVLKESQAVQLIQSRLEMSGIECAELQLRLANLLGCLPLALQQAASYIKQLIESDVSGKSQSELVIWCIKSYIEIFDVEEEKLLGYKPSTMDIEFEELKTTLLTWRITLMKIQSLNPNAIELLIMMSYVSPENIHLKIFQAQFKEDELKLAVNTLFQFSIISKLSVNSSIVSVHRLVQRVIRLDNEKQQENTLEKLLNTLNVILEELPQHITPYTTACVAHSQVLWEHALAYPKFLKQFKDYPRNIDTKAALHGMHTTNLSLLQRTLSRYKFYGIYGESNEHYITVQDLIVVAMLDLHKYEDAKSMCKLILKTAEDELGEFHQLTLAILNNLAVAESGLGNYSEMAILDKIIAVRTASPNIGPYHKDTLTYRHNKAASLARIGKHDEALEIFKSTLELKEKHIPEDRESINHTRSWIAFTTQMQGNFAAALQMFRKLHAELVECLGVSHTRTLQSALGIGDCLLELGEYEGAVVILYRNIELAEGNPDAELECVNMKRSIAKVLLKMEKTRRGNQSVENCTGRAIKKLWGIISRR